MQKTGERTINKIYIPAPPVPFVSTRLFDDGVAAKYPEVCSDHSQILHVPIPDHSANIKNKLSFNKKKKKVPQNSALCDNTTSNYRKIKFPLD